MAEQPLVTITSVGETAVAAGLLGLGVSVGPIVVAVTNRFGRVLQAQVRVRAARLFDITDYDRSIGMRTEISAGRIGVSVGTDEPQGYRLEFGFVGVDSLGRSYHQAPRPHFGPALDAIGPAYQAAIAAAVLS